MAPADRLDEVLHDRRPDRAGQVVAAGADRHRDAAPAHEPQRGVGHQRREGGRAAEQRRAARRARARTASTLPDSAGGDEAAAQARRRRSGSAASRRSGRPAGPSGCRRGRSRPSAACRAARRRRARRRTRPAPPAAPPTTTYMPRRADRHQRQRDDQARPGVAGVGGVLDCAWGGDDDTGSRSPTLLGHITVETFAHRRARPSTMPTSLSDAHGVYPIAPTPFARRRRASTSRRSIA